MQTYKNNIVCALFPQPGVFVEGVHVLVHDELVIAQTELAQRAPSIICSYNMSNMLDKLNYMLNKLN